MSRTVGIQRLYESQTHGVAGHSSTNEGSPSCAVNNAHADAHLLIFHVALLIVVIIHVSSNRRPNHQLAPASRYPTPHKAFGEGQGCRQQAAASASSCGSKLGMRWPLWKLQIREPPMVPTH